MNKAERDSLFTTIYELAEYLELSRLTPSMTVPTLQLSVWRERLKKILDAEEKPSKSTDLLGALEDSITAAREERKREYECGCPDGCSTPGPGCMRPRRWDQ